MCANPAMAVATEYCCGHSPGHPRSAARVCEYMGERMTFDSAQDRCNRERPDHVSDEGLGLCDFDRTRTYEPYIDCREDGGTNVDILHWNTWHWTTASCSLKAKINADGFMALVHEPDQTIPIYGTTDFPPVASLVDATKTLSFFSVNWQKDIWTGEDVFPSPESNCFHGSCVLMPDNTCLCDVKVIETTVFDSIPSTASEVLSQLKIGAFSPDTFDSNTYRVLESNSEVTVYRKSGFDDYSKETIFEVRSPFDNSKKMYLKNTLSQITVRTRRHSEVPTKDRKTVYAGPVSFLSHFLNIVFHSRC